ncbi:ParB N-terminal domain-containing protein [Leptospira sanjuanensis]|uniref:ParB N-terminal domain-containing protein n=1 Tax=Leptospira sanjuanensis TaxID=2879643 RepID=UPI001EE8FDD5|nr:ParB N-terminal domain-containing protein [Leptospira sanjuanensis]MCG6170246.1 ParB N-terminal domain-containing protein [Leptospira sanjuanensis]
MEVLEKDDINSELAETILDKVHLAMSKENPDWQDWAMEDDGEDWKEYELNTLSRNGLLFVLRNSKKELTPEACTKLAKEFKDLGAKFLSDFLIQKSKFSKKKEAAEEEIQTKKSESQNAFSNVLKARPTPAQILAGNYKKTHISVQGIPITIENKKGSYRTGTDPDGKSWRTKLVYDYGYIKRTTGADGDHVDVFVGPDSESRIVFVINQRNKDGSFDEHKCMIGFHDEKAARIAYLKNYTKNWKGLGSVIALTVPQFKEWISSNYTKKELKEPRIEFLKSKISNLKDSLKFISKPQIKNESTIEVLKSYLQFEERETLSEVEENDESLLLEIRKSIQETKSSFKQIKKADLGRPSEMVGTEHRWNDGKTHRKEIDGWSIVSEKELKEKDEIKKKRKRVSERKETTPKKGHTFPTKLPFSKIRTIAQYTDKKDYDRKEIEKLKNLIKNNGYDPAYPMSVDRKDGQWTVVAGHHRYEAVKELIAEGELPNHFEIPVVEKEFASKNDRLAAQISENQRRLVLATDEARAYSEMVKEGWDAKKISEKLGVKVGDVNKRLALNNLAPELYSLVHKKDKSLPLGIAEVIGMFALDANEKPNHTMQIRAFKWYVENRSKYGTRGASVLQNYIKELRSGEFENFDFDSVASNIQKEALKTIGSTEKASANRKMLEVMLDNLTKTYNRVLGDNITTLSPDVAKELAASLALTADKGVESVSVLGRLGVIIQDLTHIKNSIQNQLKGLSDDSEIPMLFARAYLLELDNAIELTNVLKSSYSTEIAA